MRVLGVPDDRGQDAVDVEQDGAAGRIGPQGGERVGERDRVRHVPSMPAMPPGRTLALAVTGTAAGVFSGLFGVGGGVVIVPLLVLWLGLDVRTATGTSLAAIVVIAGAAALAQGALRQRPRRGRPPGRPPGRRRRARRDLAAAAPAPPGGRPRLLGLPARHRRDLRGPVIEALALGFGAGLVAGLLGVGGGTLFIPGLVLLSGLSQVDAEATSLLAIVPVALVGAWRQARYGNLRLRDGVVLGVLAVPGSVAGVALANVLPERAVELAFAAFLVLVAARLAREALRAEPEQRPGPETVG